MRGTYLNTLSQVKFCENVLYLLFSKFKLYVTVCDEPGFFGHRIGLNRDLKGKMSESF